MKRGIIVTILIITIILIGVSITSCSLKEQGTGKAVHQAGLLQIKVVDEAGELVTDAEIYMNNIYKGKTSKYGESKGTKLVILDGDSNWIFAEKEGYFSSKPTSVSSAAVGGDQRMTIILQKERSFFLIEIVDKQGKEISGAVVSLHEQRKSITVHEQKEFLPLQKETTDEYGLATMDKVDDGIYFIRITHPKYTETILDEEEIIFAEDGAQKRLTVEMERLPHLDIEVVNENNQPLTSAEVTLYTKADFNLPGADPLHISYTNSEGTVSYNDIIVEEYYIFIVKREGYIAQTEEVMIGEDNQEITISLSPLED